MRSELSACLSMADHSCRGAYGLGSDHRRRSEISLVKYEVKCLSFFLSVCISMADHSGRGCLWPQGGGGTLIFS